MAFLLDTNVISETVRARPEQRVLDWLSRQRPEDLFLCAPTLGELIRGMHRLADTRRRDVLRNWIETELTAQFDGRVLAFDENAAAVWGRMMGEGDRQGQTLPSADGQIAAIASHHALTVATRNTRDMQRFACAVFNPWTE